MSTEPSLYRRCAEDIALLELLGKIASPPTRHCHDYDGAPSASEYSLTLRSENDLVRTLSFLSSIEDDINNVTAVCVQECDPGLAVLVAANASKVSDSQYLESVRTGFDNIFSLLNKASMTSFEDLEDSVSKAIIVMCRRRILTRARLNVSENEKPPWQRLLQGVRQGLNRIPRTAERQSVCDAAQNLIEELNDCKASLQNPGRSLADRDAAITRVILGFLKLSGVPNLRRVLLQDLEGCRPVENPSTREAVFIATRKMSQYKLCATRLVRLARRYALLRRASTVMVRLPAEAFDKQPLRSTLPLSAEDVLKRVGKSTGVKLDYRKTLRKLQLTPSKADEDFSRFLKNATKDPRVHAEIQLCWYLDRHPGPKPPRILASNKDACFLCQAFVASQGKYTMPGFHGRVYEGWRAPVASSEAMSESHYKFVADLERMIARRARQIQDEGVMRLPPPLESPLMSSMGSLSTVLTVQPGVGGEEEEEEEEVQSSSGTESSTETETGTATPRPVAVFPQNCDPQITTNKSDESLRSRDDGHRTDSADDTPWKTVPRGKPVFVELSEQLHVVFEYSAGGEATAERQKGLRIRATEGKEVDVGTIEDENPQGVVHNVISDLPLLKDVPCETNCSSFSLKIDDQIFCIELGDENAPP